MLARVLDEAVAIAIAVVVDPFQGSQDVRPDLAQEFDVRGALVVGGGKHDEQRRAVDGAVVAAEGHLAQLSHFALAHLVQDFAGLRIALWIDAGGLRGGQVTRARPCATEGASHSSSSAVMMPSRPNTVLNHGTPA